jgi:ligand-binding SRPBCC domain-containing protein
MIAFGTSVRIERPTEAVFDYISDPSTLPRWNSAVQAVRPLPGNNRVERSRYVMERDLPSGRAVNELEVVTHERPMEFVVRTISGPTPFVYRYRFAGENGETVVRLDAEVELDGIASLLAPVAGRAIKRGVDANFRVLKEVLETRR